MLVTEITAQSIDEALKKQLEQLNVSVESREVGTVIQVGDGIARVDGLRDAMAGELLEFIGEGGKTVYGLAQNLEEDEVGAVLLGDVTAIKENDQVRTTGRIVEVPAGKAMLGRVVNPLGQPIDGKGPIKAEGTRPVEWPSTPWCRSAAASASSSSATARLVRPLSRSTPSSTKKIRT